MESTPLENMIELLEKRFPKADFRPSSKFYNDGSKGIWCPAEPGPVMEDGLPAFDYWSEDIREKTYRMGVHKGMVKLLDENGYYAEFHDPGTVMIFPA